MPINLVPVAEDFIERVLERNQGVEVLEGVLGELDHELMIGHALTLGGVQQPLDMACPPRLAHPLRHVSAVGIQTTEARSTCQ